jgi:hypothetical protein
MWLIFAAISALVGSAAGMVKELVETLTFKIAERKKG